MGVKERNNHIDDIFSRYDESERFFWYSTSQDKYIGFLDHQSVGRIRYDRLRDEICVTLKLRHIDYIADVVIYVESRTKGLPNALMPVFIGTEWVDEWNDMD